MNQQRVRRPYRSPSQVPRLSRDIVLRITRLASGGHPCPDDKDRGPLEATQCTTTQSG